MGKYGDTSTDVTVYADYNQFYLGDSLFDANTDEGFWTDEALERKFAISYPSLIGVGTTYQGNIPVVIEVCTEEPADDDLAVWDRVVEGSLSIPSAAVAVGGCMEYIPEIQYRNALTQGAGDRVRRSPHIAVDPGTYRVRVYAGGIDTERITEVDGELIEACDEHYRIVMWPAPYRKPHVLYTRA